MLDELNKNLIDADMGKAFLQRWESTYKEILASQKEEHSVSIPRMYARGYNQGFRDATKIIDDNIQGRIDLMVDTLYDREVKK